MIGWEGGKLPPSVYEKFIAVGLIPTGLTLTVTGTDTFGCPWMVTLSELLALAAEPASSNALSPKAVRELRRASGQPTGPGTFTTNRRASLHEGRGVTHDQSRSEIPLYHLPRTA